MTDKTRLGFSIMAAALAAGALGDGLLRATPWGVNLFVWVAALAALAAGVLILNRVDLDGGSRRLVIPLLFFAAAIAWRDSPVLRALSLIGIVITLAMILMRSKAGKLLAAGVTDFALGVLISLYHALTGAGYLIGGEIEWKEIPHDGLAKHLAPVAKGLAIAFPLLLIFGGLLASADAVFSNLIIRLFDWDVESLVVHCLLTAFIAWGVAGFLRGVVTGKEMKAGAANRPGFLWLGVTETAIVLGLLDVLFLKFVVVQFQYFFGGAARIQAVAGLTYAEYARRGFFELVGVAALVLPLLLAAVFVWFAMTVLRGRRERFAFGAVATGFLAIGALLAVNPDRLIARVNVERAIAGRDFDAAYAASLSADAAPELIAALPKLNRSQRCALASQILQSRPIAGSPGWRRWNWSRAEAARALAAGEQELRESACQ